MGKVKPITGWWRASSPGATCAVAAGWPALCGLARSRKAGRDPPNGRMWRDHLCRDFAWQS
ncbi:hypothetical protein C2I36_04730 [Rhodobacteraceae bacterium WD3A24]|nr:hypothetical protein C2I36_04730 [Rhodobacteraceae bacterium WD3A24]